MGFLKIISPSVKNGTAMIPLVMSKSQKREKSFSRPAFHPCENFAFFLWFVSYAPYIKAPCDDVTTIISNIKINDDCGKMYENCVKSLGKYSKYFVHGLGHGVGVEIHELPNLSLGSKDKIMENMVFTVEPGVYIPKKFGIRIEDALLMKKKVERLTKVSKDLLIV